MAVDFPEYESHDALGLAELVRNGEIDPSLPLEAAIARMEERNPALNAIVIPMLDQARAAVAAGLPKGPLTGAPYLLKDLAALFEGSETTNGSQFFAGAVADHDSELTARYKRAGLVVFGKSASPEFGLTTTTESTLFGATLNPWNPAHTAGGSSGGAAAAVAARILPAAHASDGGGSIRIPASCCGLFGLKPSRGLMPFGPDVGEGWSGMSTTHAVSRSVRDSAALLDATHGCDVGAPYAAPQPARPYLDEVGSDPGPLRVAIQTRAFNDAAVHEDCAQAARDAGALCETLGHRVEEAEITIDVEPFLAATRTIISANLLSTFEDRAKVLGREFTKEDCENLTFLMMGAARAIGAADYARSIRVIHEAGRRVANFLQQYDVILTPTMGAPPEKIGVLSLSNPDLGESMAALMRSTAFTQLFNASGHPAMSVPLSWNAAGLPIGAQFAGRFGDEATLFRLAAQLERAQPWFDRAPAR